MKPSNVFVNTQRVNYTEFNDLEVQAVLENIQVSKNNKVEVHFRSLKDLIILEQVKYSLDRLNLNSIQLIMPYIPYERYDRVFHKKDTHSLKLFINHINAMNFDNVVVFDPHSDASENLINNVTIISSKDILLRNDMYYLPDYDAVVAPDLGSVKKVSKLNLPTVIINQVRDSQGKLTNFEVLKGLSVQEPLKLLVVDDICDKGGTFIGTAKLLRSLYDIEQLDLYVTHGMFTKGSEHLFKLYDNIACCFLWDCKETSIKKYRLY